MCEQLLLPHIHTQVPSPLSLHENIFHEHLEIHHSSCAAALSLILDSGTHRAEHICADLWNFVTQGIGTLRCRQYITLPSLLNQRVNSKWLNVCRLLSLDICTSKRSLRKFIAHLHAQSNKEKWYDIVLTSCVKVWRCCWCLVFSRNYSFQLVLALFEMASLRLPTAVKTIGAEGQFQLLVQRVCKRQVYSSCGTYLQMSACSFRKRCKTISIILCAGNNSRRCACAA